MDKQKQKKVTFSKCKKEKKQKAIVVSIGDKKLVSIRYINKVPHQHSSLQP